MKQPTEERNVTLSIRCPACDQEFEHEVTAQVRISVETTLDVTQ